MNNSHTLVRARWAILSAATLALLVALVVLFASATLHAPRKDLTDLAILLTLSGGVTLGIGLAGKRLGLGRLTRTVRSKLLLLPALASALALANVAITARLMFISSHDLGLLITLIVFSLGMSAVLALVLSTSINEDVTDLVRAVRKLGAGDLTARAAPRGNDELRELSESFNAMAAKLESKIATQKEVEEARRLLVATVSHDLRTPLASMRVIVESINDGVVSDPDTVRRYLRTLQHETEYLSRLIDDLFELSQIDAGILGLHLEPANIKDLISDTLQSLAPQANEKGVRVTGRAPELVSDLVIDTQRVQRVLYNLVQNAVRHTPADGSVAISATESGEEVRVSVADSGEGIAPEEMPHLFERFHRTDQSRSRAHGSAGLGLSIARGIVEAHGGRIWAESSQGRGSTFTFSLPKRRPSAV